MLEQLLFTVTVEAMPGNIPDSLTVDISHLQLGDQLHISDLPIPTGVSVLHEAEELVVHVTIPRGLGEDEAGEGEEEGEATAEAGGDAPAGSGDSGGGSE